MNDCTAGLMITNRRLERVDSCATVAHTRKRPFMEHLLEDFSWLFFSFLLLAPCPLDYRKIQKSIDRPTQSTQRPSNLIRWMVACTVLRLSEQCPSPYTFSSPTRLLSYYIGYPKKKAIHRKGFITL